MNNNIRYLMVIIFIDLIILIFVERICDSVSYAQLATALFMQILSFFILIDSKMRTLFAKQMNSSIITLKLGVLLILPLSFYTLFLAKQGIFIQGGIRTCGVYGEQVIGSFF